MAALTRAWEFDRDRQERAAERVVHFEQGAAIFNSAVPRVYDANFVRLDSALGDMTADLAEGLVEGLQSGLRHRKLLLPDAGERLAGELGRRGWRVTRTVVMCHEGDAPGSDAEAVDPRALRAARDAAMPDRDAETRAQIAAYTELLAAANGARAFAAFSQGEMGAFCLLYEGGGVAEIDEVTTLARFRNRGLGTAVVKAAIAASLDAGNDLTFLVADANDWPRDWYARLGFRAIGDRYEAYRARLLP